MNNKEAYINSTGQDTVSSPLIMQTLAINSNSINQSVGNLPIKSFGSQNLKSQNIKNQSQLSNSVINTYNNPQQNQNYNSQRSHTSGRSKRGGNSTQIHPFHQKTFKETDLFKGANLYNLLDKNQHLYENKIFAQSSINQIKLEKESQKFRILMDDQDNPQFQINNQYLNSQRPMTTTGLGVYGQSAASLLNTQNNFRPASQQTLLSSMTAKNQSQQNFNNINKSIAKLETISQMNWSKKDFNLDKISQNSQVFKRYLSTVDPQMFKSQKDLAMASGLDNHSALAKQAMNDFVSTAQEGSKHSMYFSTRARQAVKSDKVKEFYSMAMDMNNDGKQKYYASQLQHNEITNTIRVPQTHSTGQFDSCKIQNKAYRANSQTQTIFKEKNREKKSLINYQTQPFDPITLRNEVDKLTNRRPMTTITQGQCAQVYGISDFTHLSRITAPNHHEDYQRAVTTNTKLFRRQNGPFTDWFNQLKTQKFISVPFQAGSNKAAAGLQSR
eukprot:403336563